MKIVISEFESENILFNHIVYTNPKEKKFELHTHDISEILFLKKGDVFATVGAKTYKILRDSLVIFRANVSHKIKAEKNTDYERYDIIFDENSFANGIFKKIPCDVDVINFSENERISALLENLDYYSKIFSGEDLKILVKNTVEEILYNIYIMPKNNSQSTAVFNPIVTKAVEFINENYTDNITIEEICKHVFVTKSYLHQLFVKHLQTTPKKYINVKRLIKAQNLIKSGENPSNVYSKCGFFEYVTFFRNYTSYFGYKPSEREKIVLERKIKS